MPADDLQRRSDDIPDALFADASRWHVRLREPDVADSTVRAFEAWRSHDPRHARAYAEAERLWAAFAQPAGAAATDNRREIAGLIRQARQPKSRRGARGAVVGLGLIAMIAAAEWWRRGGFDDLQADYVTRPGASQTYRLADGSEVTLNTDTSIAVDLDPQQRRIRVFRGEAFFSVAHDAARPFWVTTPDGTTRAVGTAFNVRKRDADTIVSLVEGRVEVAAAHDASLKANLAAGEEAELDRSRIGPIKRFDADAVTAWRRGQVVFFQTPLGDVVEELNRYRRGRIVILGNQLRDIPVTGVFDVSRPDETIGIIEATLGVTVTRLTDALVLLR